jgi:hypothetical protein
MKTKKFILLILTVLIGFSPALYSKGGIIKNYKYSKQVKEKKSAPLKIKKKVQKSKKITKKQQGKRTHIHYPFAM